VVKRVQKGGMRGTQGYSDVHCLVIPEDLFERFDVLTPSEDDPNPPTPNRQDVPPGDEPNRHVEVAQPAGGAAQPARGGSPTGTTCLLPITHQPEDHDLPTDDSGFGTQPTTGDNLLAELIRIDELAARRRGA
jgi:hypothetical protein